MQRLVIILLFLTACAKQVKVQAPSETPDQYLQRTQNTTCAQITHAEENTGPDDLPSCAKIVRYHNLAIQTMLPIVGDKIYDLKMDNVTYIRKVRIYGHNYPSGYLPFSGGPAIDMLYNFAVPDYPTPIFATAIIGSLEKKSPYRWLYEIRYASEESVYCEELHRIASEFNLDWWAHAGHYEKDFPDTYDDKLMFNCHADWFLPEYNKNHSIQ